MRILCDCLTCKINDAIESNNLKQLEHDLKEAHNKDDINSRFTNNQTPLMYAIDMRDLSEDNDEMILCLLDNGADPNLCHDEDGDSILTTMFRMHDNFNDRIYKKMFEKGIDPNYTEGYIGRLYGGPIGFAVRHDIISPAVLSLSLKYGLSYSTYKKFVNSNNTCEVFFRLFCYLVCESPKYSSRSKVKLPPEFTRVLGSFLLF